MLNIEPGKYFLIGDIQVHVIATNEFDQITNSPRGWISSGSKATIFHLRGDGGLFTMFDLNGTLFFLSEKTELNPSEIGSLQEYASRFGRLRQAKGSVQFKWGENEWDITDIGRLRGDDGDSRFITAESGTKVLFVVDHKNPQYPDVMWTGTIISPSDIRLERRCPYCSSIIKNEAKKCSNCGANL